MKGETSWHTALVALLRVGVLALAMLLGAALDAGLLDRTLAARVCRVLDPGPLPVSRPSESSSSSPAPVPSQLLRLSLVGL